MAGDVTKTLKITILGDAKGGQRAVKDFEGSVKGLDKTTKNVGSTFAKGFNTQGIQNSISGIVSFGKESAGAFQKVRSESLALQKVMGGNITDASKFRFAAEETGVPIDTLQKGLGKLSKGLASNSKDVKSLGIDYRDAHGQLKPMNDIFPQILDKLSKMPAGAQKTALMMNLFGKSALQLTPLLNKSGDQFKGLTEEADKFGLTIDGKTSKAMGDQVVAQRQWHAALEGVKVQIGASVIPVMTKFATILAQNVAPWVQKVTGFLRDHSSVVTKIATVIGILAVAVMAINKGFAMYQAIVKAATVVQSIFNAVMGANPIVLVVLAIAALAAGVIYAYTHFKWFRDTVQAIWSFLKTAFIDTLHALQATWNAVWGAISFAARAYWLVISTIVKTYIAIVRTVIETALNVIRATWNFIWSAIHLAIRIYWAAMVTIVKTYIAIVRTTIDTVLKVISAIWHTTWSVIVTTLRTIWNVLTTIVRTEINGIKVVISTVLNVIRTVWSTAWNGIKTFFTGFWDSLKRGASAGISGVKKAIDLVWSGIRDTFKAPVKFVINTVLDDWIIGGINKVGGFFHLPKIPDIPRLATGGLLHGPGTGTSDSILGVGANGLPTARVSHGEYVVNARSTSKYLPLIEAINAGQLPGLKGGGPVGWLKGGIGKLGDLSGDVLNAGASALIDKVLSPVADGISGAMGGFGWPGQLVGAMPKWLVSQAANWFRAHDIPPIADGSPGTSWPLILAYARKSGIPIGDPSGGQTTGGGHANGSWHYKGMALDIGSAMTGNLRGVFDWFSRVKGSLLELFYDPAGRYVKNGNWVNGAIGGHTDHVHVAASLAAMQKLLGIDSGPAGENLMGSVQSIARQLAASRGWLDQWSSIDYIAQHESGWRTNVKNPSSTAYGVGQLLTETSNNPTTQVRNWFNYIAGRYGNPASAEGFWRRHGWYAKGGLVGLANGGYVTRSGRILVGENGPEVLDLPAGSAVTPMGGHGDINVYVTVQGSVTKERDLALTIRDYIVDDLRRKGKNWSVIK